MNEALTYAPWPASSYLWLDAWRWLEPAAAKAAEGVVESDVAALLDQQMAQLWLAYRGDDMVAACVTQRHGDCLHFWLCGGDGCDWRRLGDAIMECAAMDGCDTFSFGGRRGWLRYLPDAICED